MTDLDRGPYGRRGHSTTGTESTVKPDLVVVLAGSTNVSVGFGVPAPPEADVIDLGCATVLPAWSTHTHCPFDAQ